MVDTAWQIVLSGKSRRGPSEHPAHARQGNIGVSPSRDKLMPMPIYRTCVRFPGRASHRVTDRMFCGALVILAIRQGRERPADPFASFTPFETPSLWGLSNNIDRGTAIGDKECTCVQYLTEPLLQSDFRLSNTLGSADKRVPRSNMAIPLAEQADAYSVLRSVEAFGNPAEGGSALQVSAEDMINGTSTHRYAVIRVRIGHGTGKLFKLAGPHA